MSPPLGSGAEFDRIREIVRVLGSAAVGLGDDCAIIPHGQEFLALSTDTSVEDVHFRLDWMQLEEVGWRATAAALSDLAADGAEPLGLLCAVTVPASATETEVSRLMDGVGQAAKQTGATIVGGDLSAGPVWSMTVTVVGRTAAPVTRRGARRWRPGAEAIDHRPNLEHALFIRSPGSWRGSGSHDTEPAR